MAFRAFIYYLVAANLAAFVVYGVDKWLARRGGIRVSEKRLLLLAALGGSLGALLGIYVWHHKTLHSKFRYGVPAIIAAQIAACYLLFYR